jgi:hypothetical protein
MKDDRLYLIHKQIQVSNAQSLPIKIVEISQPITQIPTKSAQIMPSNPGIESS